MLHFESEGIIFYVINSSDFSRLLSGEERKVMKHVLVVDDMPEIRMVLKALLEEPEVEVLEAGNGREALELLEGVGVDLVVTDCQMPTMTGVELMAEAKTRYPKLPFIVVSSTAREEDLQDLQPLAVMSKPFRMSDLKEAVDQVLAHG